MKIATKEAVQPAIRFHGFNGEYLRTRLGECSSFISKGTTPKKFTPDGIRYLRSDCVGDGYVDPGPCLFIDERTHTSALKRSQLQAGDVLFAIAGSIGKVGVVKEEHLPANTNQALAIIRLKETVSRDLIVQMLQSHVVFDYVRLNTSVGAQPNLSLEQVGNLAVSLPTLPEQQKIAAFLGAVDRKIQQLKRKQALLEQYKKGVVQQLFSQELRFKREDGGEFPEWEEKRLGDVCEIAGGGTPDTDVPEYWNGDIQWFTPTEIKGKYVSKSKRTITKLGLQKSNAVLLPVGTILFTSRATIGEISFATEECATNQGFQSVIVSKGTSSEFVYQWILWNRQAFLTKAQGSTFIELSKKEMVEIPIQLPSLEEQTRIAGFLMALDAKVAGVAQAVAAAQRWKKGLLQQMFV
jgi:type I restriction enzyme S subunit